MALENGLTLTARIGAAAGFSGRDGTGGVGQLSGGLTWAADGIWSIDASVLLNLEADGLKSVGVKLGVGGQF